VKIGSLFSGGGGGDHGFVTAGHEIVFGCEIDPKARSVFRHNHPGVPVYNDVREVTYERLQADGTVIPDLIFGGSPCQDLSVAGKRAGLGGERSGLFHEQCRIADELGTPWVVWENVVGAFSSNKGADFAAVLGGLTGNTPTVPRKGWRTGGVCVGPKRVAVWRVLDAQNFGVPQRRRRVFVVAGPRTLARRIVEVLFEPESGDWDSEKSRQQGKETSVEIEGRVATSSVGKLTDIAQCIEARYGSRGDLDTESFVLDSPDWAGSAQQADIAAPLLNPSKGGQRTTDIDGGTWVVHDQPVDVFAAFDSNWSGRYDLNNDGSLSPTVKVASSNGGNAPAVAHGGDRTVVRRLTPLECERLMGWPDGWTAQGVDDGGVLVDIVNTQRYRICGNGIVATVTEWIGGRLPPTGV